MNLSAFPDERSDTLHRESRHRYGIIVLGRLR